MIHVSSGIAKLAILCAIFVSAGFHEIQAGEMANNGAILVNGAPPTTIYSYEPMIYQDESWMGSTFWTGPDWTRVGKDWQHPGIATQSVRCFISPQDGHATITGCVRKGDTNDSDGIRAFIRHEVGTVWQAEIDGNDAVGVTHALELDLHEGDTVRFIVHRRGVINCDSTYWDPEIAFENGSRFRASEGFSLEMNSSALWHYEMETTPADPKAEEYTVSRLYAFTTRLSPQTWNLDEASAPIILSPESHMPFAILTRRGAPGGTIIIMNSSMLDWRITASAPDPNGIARIQWNSSSDEPRVLEFAGDWRQAMNTPELEGIFQAYFERQKQNASFELPTLSPMLWALVTEAWMREDVHLTIPSEFTAAAVMHLERCLILADALKGSPNADFAAQARVVVASLLDASHAITDIDDSMELYVKARRIKRELLLRRPEMSFGQLLFCKRTPPSYSHLVMQYFGWRARPGGGIFILDHPGYSLEAHDIFDGRLSKGSVLQPCLDWEGNRILFSYVDNAGRPFSPEEMNNEKDDAFYHLWSANVDGSDLRQMTSGAFDDLMPAWLPDGDIVFCSTRKKGYSRCFGPGFSSRWHSYTLHKLGSASGEITRMSSNDVNEWFPVISNDGMIYYSRWDYIDRDAVTHQALWSSRPDGTNPMAIWGNGLPNPHCTFQMQPIPGSRKFIWVASAHHSITAGSLVVLDPELGENAVEGIQRITPEVPFPESESMRINEWYAAPWPLAEDLYLTAYSPYPLVWEPGANRQDALGIYLINAAGDKELIYRDPVIGSTNPIPLRPRLKPPVVTSTRDSKMGDMGEFFVANVYDGLNGIVEPGVVKELRVIQIFPKTTNIVDTPPIGLAGEENARAVLGTVPVATDGSARFLAPAHKALLFQLLDEHGRAVQTMRSLTYLQPGERTSCAGCHEGRMKTAPNFMPTAMRGEADNIKPGPFDGKPFSYMRIIQPILDKNCIQCHNGDAPSSGMDLTSTPDRGFTRSYNALLQDRDARKQNETGKPVEPLVPRYMARNQIQITPPGGQNGSRGSLLLKIIDQGHYNIVLTPEEKRLIAMWIDCNAIFYGASSPEQQMKQFAGEEIPMPEIE